MGKNLLNSGFEDFLNGSGVWIVVGVLAATFVVSMVFLILNILKDKKAAQKEAEAKAEEVKALNSEEEKEEPSKQEEIKEVQVEETEEKPKRKRKAKQEVEVSEEKEAEVKNEAKEEKTEEVKEEKPKAKRATKKVSKEEPLEEERKEEAAEEKPKAKKTTKKPAKEEQVEEEKPVDEKEVKKEEKKITYGVTYDKEKREWVVKKTGSTRASKRCSTKAEALEVAERLSEANGASLRVHKKNGKFQKQ